MNRTVAKASVALRLRQTRANAKAFDAATKPLRSNVAQADVSNQ